MKNNLLIICGPTSTGKTTLAISLAKKFNGEIISADSRQVYKGMDIGTGKGLPLHTKLKTPWFSKFGYYQVEGIKIWGYDLTDPRKDFSVTQYLRFSEKTIADIVKRKRLPIVAGGTGFYIKAIVDGIPTADVSKNETLRKNLIGKSVEELYEMLARLDAIRAAGMNLSDKKNPRRLIRAIEVAMSNKKLNIVKSEPTNNLFIGLTAPGNFLFDQIKKSVDEREKMGIEAEIKKLLKQKVSWEDQSMTTLGYSQWKEYFNGKKRKQKVISDWQIQENKYAKRQMVWFKKDKRIIWFDITKNDFQEKVEKLIEKWYKQPATQNA